MELSQILLPLVIEGKISPIQADLIREKIGHIRTSTPMVEIYELIVDILNG